MSLNPIEIDALPPASIMYSICTLVTDWPQYEAMVTSFKQAGFGEDCEFLYVDNATRNKYDAYAGLNRLLSGARGRYVICCHQDILLTHDKRADLEARLAELEAQDPLWAVVGNAGGASDLNQLCVRITDPYGENRRQGAFPFKAYSLDENFLLLKRAANLGFSADLTGFHFYGTDICLLANTAGFQCYVIDFHLTHHSKGNKNASFYDCERALIQKYRGAFRSRFIRTTCTRLFISGRQGMVSFWNKPRWMRWARRWQRWTLGV